MAGRAAIKTNQVTAAAEKVHSSKFFPRLLIAESLTGFVAGYTGGVNHGGERARLGTTQRRPRAWHLAVRSGTNSRHSIRSPSMIRWRRTEHTRCSSPSFDPKRLYENSRSAS